MVEGPVFAATSDDLGSVRRALEWYPDDVWRYALASDWERIAQELPLVGRAADAGDDAGSRLLTARVAHAVMHLAFLVERRWAPYSKWFGTVFRSLPCAADVAPGIGAALRAGDGLARQRGLAEALDAVNERQRALGLSTTAPATIPFWDRPYIHPDPRISDELRAGIVAEGVRRLPRGRGTVEQRTHNVDVLVDLPTRRSAVAD